MCWYSWWSQSFYKISQQTKIESNEVAVTWLTRVTMTFKKLQQDYTTKNTQLKAYSRLDQCRENIMKVEWRLNQGLQIEVKRLRNKLIKVLILCCLLRLPLYFSCLKCNFSLVPKVSFVTRDLQGFSISRKYPKKEKAKSISWNDLSKDYKLWSRRRGF